MSIMSFLRITKKKLAVGLLFPVAAVVMLVLGFVCDEVLGLGTSAITHAIYSAANYAYCSIFLPLTFVDSDSSAPALFKIALLLTPISWYLLACMLVALLSKRGESEA